MGGGRLRASFGRNCKGTRPGRPLIMVMPFPLEAWFQAANYKEKHHDHCRSPSHKPSPPSAGLKGRAQALLVGRVRFLFTITGFWLRRMALALRMAAMRKSGRYLFFRIMCRMLLRVARAFLLMVVRT